MHLKLNRELYKVRRGWSAYLQGILLMLFLVLLFTGCSVTKEKYRYQHRFDHFYSLLNGNEQELFRKNDLKNLGISIDNRIKNGGDFAKELKKVTEYEAIATFSGQSTASFFRNTILRELNRPHFYRLMDELSAKEQIAFVRGDFLPIFKQKLVSDKKFKNLIRQSLRDYRLIGFTSAQIYDYYRQISFNEVSRRYLFSLLEVLKQVGALNDFLLGYTVAANEKLDQTRKNNVVVDRNIDEIKKRCSLTHVSSLDLLKLYSEVIMKKMDPYVLKRTIGKFY